jgi:hypothetical protein
MDIDRWLVGWKAVDDAAMMLLWRLYHLLGSLY